MGSIGFNSSGQFMVGGNPVNYGKNYIINGGFNRWDYATSQTSSGYGSDNRWHNSNNGSTKTHSQVASTDTERALFNSPYFSRTVVTSVAGVSNYIQKFQRIENVTKLAGKTITISFWAKADSNKNINVYLSQAFGTGGTPSSPITVTMGIIGLTSTWQKKSITITLPSIVGKTLGTDGVYTTATQIGFSFDGGASSGFTIGQQSGTFDIAEVQLEEGSVATPWTQYNGEFGGEVQACGRYLPIGDYYSAGQAYATTLAGVVFTFKDKARIAPTGILSSGTFSLTTAGGGSTSATSPVLSSPSSTSTAINFTTSGLTAGYATILLGATGSILFTGCEL